MKQGTIRQILLLTDGCSNSGEDPIAIATLAKEEGLSVNVIGIMDEGDESSRGLGEVESIAQAGGGMSEVVYAKQLSQTVQMVTRKAMTQTIFGVVNHEIKHILGTNTEMEDLSPEKRGDLVEVVEEIGENASLEILVLVDTSASMKNKLPRVQEALLDLAVSLNSRTGENDYCLYSFPGKRNAVDRLLAWTPQLDSLKGAFKKITMSGVTPTGPALKEAMKVHLKRMKKKEGFEDDEGSFMEQTGL